MIHIGKGFILISVHAQKSLIFAGAPGIFRCEKHNAQSFRRGPLLFLRFCLVYLTQRRGGGSQSQTDHTWLGIPVFPIMGSPELHPIVRGESASGRDPGAGGKHVNVRDMGTGPTLPPTV